METRLNCCTALGKNVGIGPPCSEGILIVPNSADNVNLRSQILYSKKSNNVRTGTIAYLSALVRSKKHHGEGCIHMGTEKSSKLVQAFYRVVY